MFQSPHTAVIGGVVNAEKTLMAALKRLEMLVHTLEEMKAIVDEANTHGKIVAAHAHGTEGIQFAIEAGVDSIEHASFLDEETIT